MNTQVYKEITLYLAQPWPTLCDPMGCYPQAPLSMGFSRQEYWSGLPFPSAGDLPDIGIEPGSLASSALQAGSLPEHHLGSPKSSYNSISKMTLKWTEGPEKHFPKENIQMVNKHVKKCSLNITKHQGNTNQNHNKILPHIGQNDCHKKK